MSTNQSYCLMYKMSSSYWANRRNIYSRGAYAVLPPFTVEEERERKAEYCRNLLTLQEKLPQKYQAGYSEAQNTLCKDDNKWIYDIEQYLKSMFSEDEQVEVRLIQMGKEKYCKLVLGFEKLYRADGNPKPETVPEGITTPQYTELQHACQDNSKDVSAVIPMAQQLAKIYYNFKTFNLY